MKRLFLLLIFLGSIHHAYSKISIISEKVPYELKIIIETLNSYDLIDIEKKQLEKNITQLNNVLKKISQGSYYFLLKSELYKRILNMNYPQKKMLRNISKQLIVDLKTKKKLNNKKYNSFSLWIFNSALQDAEKLADTNNHSQLKLLRPVLSLFHFESISTIDFQMKKFIVNYLKEVTTILEIYAKNSSLIENKTKSNFFEASFTYKKKIDIHQDPMKAKEMAKVQAKGLVEKISVDKTQLELTKNKTKPQNTLEAKKKASWLPKE